MVVSLSLMMLGGALIAGLSFVSGTGVANRPVVGVSLVFDGYVAV